MKSGYAPALAVCIECTSRESAKPGTEPRSFAWGHRSHVSPHSVPRVCGYICGPDATRKYLPEASASDNVRS